MTEREEPNENPRCFSHTLRRMGKNSENTGVGWILKHINKMFFSYINFETSIDHPRV
jgi:hypothetical protein